MICSTVVGDSPLSDSHLHRRGEEKVVMDLMVAKTIRKYCHLRQHPSSKHKRQCQQRPITELISGMSWGLALAVWLGADWVAGWGANRDRLGPCLVGGVRLVSAWSSN